MRLLLFGVFAAGADMKTADAARWRCWVEDGCHLFVLHYGSLVGLIADSARRPEFTTGSSGFQPDALFRSLSYAMRPLGLIRLARQIGACPSTPQRAERKSST